MHRVWTIAPFLFQDSWVLYLVLCWQVAVGVQRSRHLRMCDWVRKGSLSVTFSDVLYYFCLTTAKFTMCPKCCSSARDRDGKQQGSYHICNVKKTERKEEKSHNFSLGIKLPVTFFVSCKRAAELCKAWIYAFNHNLSFWLYLAGLAGSYTGKTSSYGSNLPENKLAGLHYGQGSSVIASEGKGFFNLQPYFRALRLNQFIARNSHN